MSIVQIIKKKKKTQEAGCGTARSNITSGMRGTTIMPMGKIVNPESTINHLLRERARIEKELASFTLAGANQEVKVD